MNTLSRTWKWLLDEQNRGALGMIGAALAVAVAACWKVFVYLSPRGQTEMTVRADPAPSADQIRAIIESLHASIKDKDALIEKLSSRLNIAKGAIRTFYSTLGQEEISEDRWPEKFADIALHHLNLLSRLDALPKDDAEVQEKLREAREAVKAGGHARAEALLSECEELDLQAAREAFTKAEFRRRRAAESRAARGELALTLIDYRAAAEHFRHAAELANGLDADLRTGFLHMMAEALYRQGEERGDNAALRESISAWHEVLRNRPRQRVPLDWAMTQNNLGTALQALGERESGTARLEEAVAAYREALGVLEGAEADHYLSAVRGNLARAERLLDARRRGGGPEDQPSR